MDELPQRASLPMFARDAVRRRALLLREPDFGAFVVIAVIAFGILFLGGMNWRRFAGAGRACCARRLRAADPVRRRTACSASSASWTRGPTRYGKGYQLSHALIAFGRGEWLGVGLGASVEKLLLPARGAHRLPARGDRRGARLRRRGGGDRAVRLARAARVRRSAARRRCSSATSRRWSRRASASGSASGVHQHGREHGPAADQGPDAAAA